MNQKAINLKGKIALVTGAGSGIGRSSAIAFADAGAAVIVVDRHATEAEHTASLIVGRGAEAISLVCDISHAQQVDEMVAAVVSRYGRLDCAFNNAGIGSPEAVTVAECSDAHWDAVMAVNLRGVFFCMRAEVRQMRKQGFGAIVNTASIGGLVGNPRAPAYIASKHGVIGLTRAAALDHGREGIRINALCPGFTEGTGMMNQFLANAPERVAFLRDSQPMGRLGTADEIAQAAVWLCSDAASFVNGATMTVDGGFTAM